MSNILVIPDVHTGLGEDTSRLAALGKFIVNRRPDKIVQLGDFADMYSLSGYDSDLRKASIIGDYWEEVENTKKALKVLFAPLNKLNKHQRKNRKKQYKPVTILTLGNHDEQRYNRVKEKDPIVLGKAISWEDLDYRKYFDTIVPYKTLHNEDGILFTHHLTSAMGRAVGGSINPARNCLNLAKNSIVVGHSHIYDYAVTTRADGSRIHSLVAGCFVGDQEFDYAKGNQHNWVDGVTMLNNTQDGDFELEFISTGRLINEYS